MKYSDLKRIFQEFKRTSPKEDLTAHIIFTEDSFDEKYRLLSRTYSFNSDNKAFLPNIGGYSIFASCLDGTDPWVRLEMKVRAYIHSLKDKERDRHVLGEAEIIRCIGDNLYLAEVNGIRCTAIFNFFTGAYYVDDVHGIQEEAAHA